MVGVRFVKVLDDQEALSRAAAAKFVLRAREAIEERGRFSVALSGGSTPRSVYRLLGEQYEDAVDWEKVVALIGDERNVPPDHEESNYRMALERLLAQVPIPHENLVRFRTENGPEAAAEAYEEEVRERFALGPSEMPRFDLVLLGLGTDAHTASLFPGTKALAETRRIAVANWVEKLATWRVTLTVPAINHARRIVFLVSGPDKVEPLRSVLEGPRDPERLPAQLIAPAKGEVHWLVDRVAAAGLTDRTLSR